MAKDRDENDNEHDEESTGKKGLGGKKIIIIVILLLLLVAGAVGVYMSGILTSSKEKEEAPAEEVAEDPHGGGHGDAKEGAAKDTGPVFYDMQEFLINLSSRGAQPSFLKMRVTLELPNQAAVAKLEKQLPRIVDAFNVYLRELRPSDLQGSAGMYRLREELLLRINKTLYPDQVNDILFKEVIVQ
jgi:flagellar FliL protein